MARYNPTPAITASAGIRTAAIAAAFACALNMRLVTAVKVVVTVTLRRGAEDVAFTMAAMRSGLPLESLMP